MIEELSPVLGGGKSMTLGYRGSSTKIRAGGGLAGTEGGTSAEGGSTGSTGVSGIDAGPTVTVVGGGGDGAAGGAATSWPQGVGAASAVSSTGVASLELANATPSTDRVPVCVRTSSMAATSTDTLGDVGGKPDWLSVTAPPGCARVAM